MIARLGKAIYLGLAGLAAMIVVGNVIGIIRSPVGRAIDGSVGMIIFALFLILIGRLTKYVLAGE